jgi:predicted acetyltransferase
MDIITEIENMCLDSDNLWFLEHAFPRIALIDLKHKDKDNYTKDIRNYIIVEEYLNTYKRGIAKNLVDEIFDDDKEEFISSKWIFPERINNELPGFILLRCNGGILKNEGFTHEIYFAFVKEKFRNKGILKNMIQQIPEEWNAWLEPSSKEIKNIYEIWRKLDFEHYCSKKKYNDNIKIDYIIIT